MYEILDGWMDRWMDGWMDGAGEEPRRYVIWDYMYEILDGWTDRGMDEWMDGADGTTYVITDALCPEYISGKTEGEHE